MPLRNYSSRTIKVGHFCSVVRLLHNLPAIPKVVDIVPMTNKVRIAGTKYRLPRKEFSMNHKIEKTTTIKTLVRIDFQVNVVD